jgi:hypothetical protein
LAETERSIRLLEAKIQDPYWFLAAKKLKKIINRNNIPKTLPKKILIFKTNTTKSFRGQCNNSIG